MERSIRSLRDPVPAQRIGERRRCIRQKLYTPVYASFNGPQTGMVVDLSELLDLHEEGFAVQTSQRLDVDRSVTVCLDLPETRNYIHCTGHVVWSDENGRGGVRFSALSEKSRQILKEWLFTNLMIGCSNHSARSEQMARRGETALPPATPPASSPGIVPLSEGSATLAAVEAVRFVIRDLGDDAAAILQLVTERALSFTGACGAALALITNEKMICRARAGEPAPPLAAPVDVKHGLSGECVRRGLLVSCEDSEKDLRVDPQVCRALGIRSLLAAPIVSDFQVIGLLEVFSPQPGHFKKIHGKVLEQLIDLIPEHHLKPTRPEPKQVNPSQSNSSHLGPMEFASIHTTSEAFLDVDPGIHELSHDEELQDEETKDAKDLNDGEGKRSDIVRSDIVSPEVKNPEVKHRADNDIHEKRLAEPFEQPRPEDVPESSPPTSSRLLYRTLLGMAIVVIFVALGYLLAPVIDKRWAVSPQASQRPSQPALQNSVQASSSPAKNDSSSTVPAQTPTLSGPQAAYLADLRQRAERGNPDAQWQLGARYHNGDGVPRDDVQAMQWFGRAAEQGQVSAQSTLGAYYFAGRGVPQDLTKAYFWSALASAQGDENSKARLESLSTMMSHEQISAARQRPAILVSRNPSVRPKPAAD